MLSSAARDFKIYCRHGIAQDFTLFFIFYFCNFLSPPGKSFCIGIYAGTRMRSHTADNKFLRPNQIAAVELLTILYVYRFLNKLNADVKILKVYTTNTINL